MAQVAVVPRLKLDRKRPHHRADRSKPCPSLFEPNKVRELYGDNSLTKCSNGWIFRRNEYNGGLLILSASPSELSKLNVNPTLDEIYLFRGSQDRVVVDAAAALASTLKLRIDDKVKVVVGDLQGTTGCLTEIHDNGTVTIVADDEQVPPLNLLRWEICKLFSQGDFVRVLFGMHQGKEGFIVNLEGNFATVYLHVPVAGEPAGHTGNMPSSEVYFF
jgi:transcription elongation factor